MLNGEMLKMVRLSKRMTQAEFGDMLDVSASTIAHIENGRRNISDTLRARLAQEVDFNEFMFFFERYNELDNIISI